MSALLKHLLDHRVVPGESPQRAVPAEIGPAVADIGDPDPALVHG